MTPLNEQVIVITGAAGSVGSVVTQSVAKTGATLALWDYDEGGLAALQQQLPDDATALSVVADLTTPEGVDKALKQTTDELGKINALMHIAGGFAMPGPVHEGHFETWQKLMTLNATAVYLTCGKVAKHMLDSGTAGSISLIAAKGGKAGGKNSAAYAASKSAALRVMESMAAELKEHRIRVNALSPSIIDTEPNREAMGADKADQWVKPEEIAETLIFLASDKASAITGANVEIYAWV